jgi:hypothetical protein
MKDYDYDQDLFIDIDQLEVEWLNQPHRYMKYAKLCIDAEKERQEAKQFFDLKKAILGETIREEFATISDDLKKQGIKITESFITSKILQHKEYQKAQDSYNKRCYEHDILKVAVESFQQRKGALENLVKLALAEWFSTPTEPKSIEKIRQKSIDEIDEIIIKDLNNNKKRRRINDKKK